MESDVIELVGMSAFSATLCVFSGIQVAEVRIALLSTGCTSKAFATCDDLSSFVQRFLIVVPVIIGLSIFSYAWWTRKLFHEFGWAVFHTIGADPKMKYMYRYYEVFVCLLKFDYFCAVGLFMQLLIVVLSSNTSEFAVTIAAIPVSLILLIGAGWSVKKEIHSLMILSLALMLASMGYVIYKMTRFYGPHASNYSTTRGTLTFFSICTLIVLAASFVVGIRCLMFFGKGLKEAHQNGEKRRRRAIFRRQSEKSAAAAGTELGEKQNGGAEPLGERRMSID